jgi:pimeloyl-ACP methyl ester carboxylesterase
MVTSSCVGSGLSVLSNDEEQNVKSMAEDALGLMKELKLRPESTILVGHSMGGSVVCELASKHTYAGLVLLGPVHPNPGAADIFAKRIDIVSKGES